MDNDTRDSIKFLAIIVGFIVGLISIIYTFCLFIGINTNPQNGDLIGQITNIKSAGIIFKANEVDIIKGGLQNGSGTLGAVHRLTYSDDQLPALQHAMDTNKEINVHYNCPLFYSGLFSDNGCYINNLHEGK